jgi:hypothetical protein
MSKSLSIMTTSRTICKFFELKGIDQVFYPFLTRCLYFRSGWITFSILVEHASLLLMKVYYNDREMVDLTYAMPSIWEDPDFSVFLDAVTRPELWPLCIHIPWAEELVSHMLGES